MSLSVVSQVRRGKLGFCYLGENPSPETPETLGPLPGTECSVVTGNVDNKAYASR